MTVIGVCLKWVSSPREPGDDRFAGLSAADQAALELALVAGQRSGAPVRAVTCGPVAAEAALRTALAAGVDQAVRIAVDDGDQPDSAEVGAWLAGALDDAATVWCGDYSADRGSGSVPAYLAHQLAAVQALGVVAIDWPDSEASGAPGEPGALTVLRRLDGGRRERLAVRRRAVISVEGSVATLRRASLRATLHAQQAPIEVRPAPVAAHPAGPIGTVTPFRPRARVVAAPAGDGALDRLRALTDAGGSPARGETFVGTPSAAAARILDALHAWGYR